MNTTLRELVAAYLSEKGYDGLYNDVMECSCTADKPMPCGNPWPRTCEARRADPDTKADVDLAHSIGLDGC